MIDGQLASSCQEIIEMWFNHFKTLGCFGQGISFDEIFEIMLQQVFRVS